MGQVMFDYHGKNTPKNETLWVYLFAIIASITLSSWINFNETVINPDAICYLLSAEAMGKFGISGAMHLCGQAQWPFYSALIYGFVQISHFSYPLAAYLLDGAFSLVSVVTFILIVKELGGSQRVLWLSALVILLSHDFNSIREYIIRDHGFWAFYLVSLLCLLRYFCEPCLTLALAWSTSLLIATLFRIEGAIFLLALPWLSFFYFNYSWRERCKFFLTLNLPLILISLAIVSWLLLQPQQTLDKLGRVAEVTNQLRHGVVMMSEHYLSVKNLLAQYVLSSDSAKEASLILFIVLCVWYLIYVVENLSWIYGLLITYGWLYGRSRGISSLTTKAAWVIGGYLVINMAVTVGFFLEHLFLSKRYLIALTLVLMLLVPFALDHLISQWNNLRHRVLLLIAALFMFISAMGGIFDFGYSKSYVHQAGNWLADNVPANATLYANDYQLMYYSRHFGDAIFGKLHDNLKLDTIAHGKWKQYDYLALRMDRKKEGEAAVLQEMGLTPVQTFSNQRGDRVVIYRIHPRAGVSHEERVS
jgi:hypothetical protein